MRKMSFSNREVFDRIAVVSAVFAILLSQLIPTTFDQAKASLGVSYDFNTAGSLTEFFNSTGSGAQESSSGGINDSGAINAQGSANAVYSSKSSYSLGPVGSTYTFAAWLQSVGNSGYSGVGFTSNSPANTSGVSVFRPSDAIGISVHGGGYVFHNGATDVFGNWDFDTTGITTVKKSTINDLLNTGSPTKWYKIVFVISRNSESTFNTRVEVWPSDASGTLLRPEEADAIFEWQNIVNSTLQNAPAIYSYINFSGDRVRYFDDYSVNLSGGATVVEDGAPVVLTTSAELEESSVKVEGNAVAQGTAPIVEKGFVYDENPNPTVSDEKVVVGSGTGQFEGVTPELQSGTYYFRAFADNGVKISYGAELSKVVVNDSETPPAIPDAPGITSVIPGPGQLVVTFTPPASDGGSPITGYQYSVDNGVTWITPVPGITVSPLTITGLDSTTTFQVQLRAVNEAGEGSASSAVPGKPLASTPSAPLITSLEPAPSELTIFFNAPESQGISPISNYKYSLDNGLSFTAFSPAQTTSPLTISGLSGGVTYSVQILAVNGAGDGEPSLSSAGIPLAIPTSPAPDPVVPLITAPVLTPTLPTPTPTPTPTGPGGSILMPVLPATPGVVFGPSNPIPLSLVEILSAPLAYVIALLTGLPDLPRMAPSESIAYENGAPVRIELVKTDSENGYVLRGDGWEVALEATDSSGEALKLDDSGNIILNDDRFVQFSGTGFAPGSIVKVWLFSDPTELSDVIANADGTFTGKSQIPEGIPTGEHTIQLNGLTQDGQLRSVSLGVLIQPDPEVAAATPPTAGADITGLMAILWTLAAGILAGFFFFILWRRRKKKEDEEEYSPISLGDNGEPIFASKGFEASPAQQFPDDSRRKTGSATPPNRKLFNFKPRNA
jgi:cbb3-type cytochrome oxidase subunit 3